MLRPSLMTSSGSSSSARTIPAAMFTLATALSAGCGAEFTISFDPHEATIQNLRTFVKTGIVPCRTLIERYQLLHDSLDPSLHAIVSWNNRVLQDAELLDQTSYGQRGSFHCV